MNYWQKYILTFSTIWVLLLPCPAQLKVILDTDPGYDPDDVGCYAMLHTLATMGECEILAMVNSTDHIESPLCISAINHFYNRKAIPVGDYKEYPKKVHASPEGYDYHIANNYPRVLENWEEAADAVNLYREILASAKDHSITVVITGTMHNFFALLKSVPCKYSELSGRALVKQKVKLVATMGGNFIQGRGYDRTNWGGAEQLCAYTSWSCLNPERNSMCRFVIENCQAPFVASGWEVGCGDYYNANYGNVMTGQGLKELEPQHIVRRSYEHHFSFRGGDDNIDRHSNDQCALYYAIRGDDSNFIARLGGDINLSDKGVCSWNPSKEKNQGYIQKQRDKNLIADDIEALMMGALMKVDTSPPNPPKNLRSVISGNGLLLTWDPASDSTTGSWIVAYNMYLNDDFVEKVHGLMYMDNTASWGKLNYEVRAVNVNGLESEGITLGIRTTETN